MVYLYKNNIFIIYLKLNKILKIKINIQIKY
jgi:hypothetical protein